MHTTKIYKKYLSFNQSRLYTQNFHAIAFFKVYMKRNLFLLYMKVYELPYPNM